MPLLLGYLSSLNQAKVGHVTKAFYALENFMENLGKEKGLCNTCPVETAHIALYKRIHETFSSVNYSKSFKLVLRNTSKLVCWMPQTHSITICFVSSLCLFLSTGADIEPYLPTLMDTMLSALNSTESLKIKELAVSAIGAIGRNFHIFTGTFSCNSSGVPQKIKRKQTPSHHRNRETIYSSLLFSILPIMSFFFVMRYSYCLDNMIV